MVVRWLKQNIILRLPEEFFKEYLLPGVSTTIDLITVTDPCRIPLHSDKQNEKT